MDEEPTYVSQVLVKEPSAGSVSTKAKETKPIEEIAKVTASPEKSEVDSSCYSVNKYNFLFYMMYKLKFMDHPISGEAEVENLLEEEPFK